jgi:hypothetical protein
MAAAAPLPENKQTTICIRHGTLLTIRPVWKGPLARRTELRLVTKGEYMFRSEKSHRGHGVRGAALAAALAMIAVSCGSDSKSSSSTAAPTTSAAVTTTAERQRPPERPRPRPVRRRPRPARPAPVAPAGRSAASPTRRSPSVVSPRSRRRVAATRVQTWVPRPASPGSTPRAASMGG